MTHTSFLCRHASGRRRETCSILLVSKAVIKIICCVVLIQALLSEGALLLSRLNLARLHHIVVIELAHIVLIVLCTVT